MQPRDASLVADEAACRRAIQQALPDFPVRSVETMRPGWDSSVFLLNARWVFRFPLHPPVAKALEREIVLLPIIARCTDVPVPRFDIVVPASPTMTLPFVGYQRLSGEPLDRVLADKDERAKVRIAEQVGRFLQDLHTIPLQHGYDAGLKPYDAGAWAAEREELITGAAEVIARELGETAWNRVSSAAFDLLERIDWHAINPVLIHGDLGAEHILVDSGQNNRVSIIDFGDMGIGDPACDFAGLPDEILPDTLQAYGRDLGEDFPLRRDLYRALVPFYALEAGQRLNRPDLVEEGVAKLALNP